MDKRHYSEHYYEPGNMEKQVERKKMLRNVLKYLYELGFLSLIFHL